MADPAEYLPRTTRSDAGGLVGFAFVYNPAGSGKISVHAATDAVGISATELLRVEHDEWGLGGACLDRAWRVGREAWMIRQGSARSGGGL